MKNFTTVLWSLLVGLWSLSVHGQEYQLNETALNDILQRLNCLHLQLRNGSEVNNTVIGYLLRQEHCSLQLSLLQETTSTPLSKGALCKHRAHVLHSNELKVFFAAQKIQRGQIVLLIFVDEPDPSVLHRESLQLWQQSGTHEVYYLTSQTFVFFNPFSLNHAEDGMKQFGQLVALEHVHPHRIFKNLNGYALRFYIFNSVYSEARLGSDGRVASIHGADAKVAQLMAQRFNYTMQLQKPDDQYFGARMANGSFDGALGRLLRYETDAVFTGFFVKDYLTRDVEFTVAVYTDELCCYVRKAKRVPQSILPLFAVNLDVWSSFFAVGFGCPFIWLLIRYVNQRLCKTPKHPLQPLRIFVDTWVVWVRVNIGTFPPCHAERIFVLSLCLVSVIFGALFESSLATVYIRPLYYPDINTLSELERAKYRIYIKHAAMKDDLFVGHTSPIYQHLDERVILVAELEDRLINMMSKLGGFAAVTRASSLLLDDISYVITKKIHMIAECPKHYHIAFVLPKYSPFEEYFNAFLLDCMQAGLIDWWVEQMKHAAKIAMHRFSNNVDESSEAWKVFTLNDLQLAFYALFLGSMLACLVFVIELLLHRQDVRVLIGKLNCHK